MVGNHVGGGVPYFKFKNLPSTDQLKSLGAALASSGSVALYHVENVTPENKWAKEYIELENIEKISLSRSEVDETRSILSTSIEKPDLICVGCPHASLEEIKTVADLVVGKQLKNMLWVCTSISVKAAAERMGYSKIIEDAGGKIVCDTCMVVAPIEELDYKVVGVDSAKAANYVPNMCGLKVVYNDLENLIIYK